MTTTVLNLDGMDRVELADFWKRVHFHPVQVARELFLDRPGGYVSTTKDLGNYAINKSVAMELRAKGDIQRALVYEAICERIYAELPGFAKW